MSFEEITTYMSRSLDERQNHLNLTDECIFIGGSGSREYRGLLAHFLKTTIPIDRNVMLCHACMQSKCSNVKHLYWGTCAENNDDTRKSGKVTCIWDATVAKYGLEKAKQMSRTHAKRISKLPRKKSKLALSSIEIQKRIQAIIDSDYPNRGWLSRVSKRLNLSHTSVRKFIEKYELEVHEQKEKKSVNTAQSFSG